MITDTFDNLSPAIINPIIKEDAVEVDACIIKQTDFLMYFHFYACLLRKMEYNIVRGS